MKQKVFIDIRIYDENMRTIFSRQHDIADRAMKQAENIIKKKIRGY